MLIKKNIHVTYPKSEKVYISGGINNIKVGMRRIELSDTIMVSDDGDPAGRKSNNPVIVYDTSGPYSDPRMTINVTTGIPRIRAEWYGRRKDLAHLKKYSSEYMRNQADTATKENFPVQHLPQRAREGKNITQMFYAKRRIITPEMEYVAIRENQQIEALGLKSFITPEFIRKEVAAGHAVIPANINHPETEPMIIGKKFLVKVNAVIDDTPKGINSIIEKVVWGCKWGCDTLSEQLTKGEIHNIREWILRNSPVPVTSVPIYQALAKVDGNIENLSWNIYKDTLIEQAEQGIDIMVIHAAMLKKHIELTHTRLTNIVSNASSIMQQWMQLHHEENFLYTHFAEICEILKNYDVTLCLGEGLRPGSIYDANDAALFSELQTMGKLTSFAWDQYVQVINEGSGHVPINKTRDYAKEQQYACHNAPICSFEMLTCDVAPGYDHIVATVGAAQIGWYGTAMINSVTPKEHLTLSDKEDMRNGIIASKIAAHIADVAKEHPGAQVRDNALSKARFEERWNDQFNLSLDPERAEQYYTNK